MNRTKRTLSMLLALLTVAAVTASCGSGSDVTDTATDNSADTTAAVTEETNEREKIREEVPADANYNGYEFRIQSRDADHHHKELTADAENGETINDAVYRRNTAV